jgi:hypothetical protein
VKKIEMIRHPSRRMKRVASLNALAMVNILFGKDESPPKSHKPTEKVVPKKVKQTTGCLFPITSENSYIFLSFCLSIWKIDCFKTSLFSKLSIQAFSCFSPQNKMRKQKIIVVTVVEKWKMIVALM